MCLILLAYRMHRHFPLVLAANRDEQYTRPTAAAAFWNDCPHIYGGRDLEKGGTWLGITRSGRIAAVTNFRDALAAKTSIRSRGELVSGFLSGDEPAPAYTARLLPEAHTYNGFNLIAGDRNQLCYASNRCDEVRTLAPGIYGLSNHLLDTPWPKVQRGKQVVAELLEHTEQELIEGLFGLLADRALAPDHVLPSTGVGLPRERVLSPAFILSPTYGTRSSSVILVARDGQVVYSERSFGPHGVPGSAGTGRFRLEPAPSSAAA